MKLARLAVVLVVLLSLLAAPSAYACSKDDTAWVESFLDSSCLGTLNDTQLDTLGGLRLQTNGGPTTTTWDTENDFTTVGPVGLRTLDATAGGALELPATALALTRSGGSLGPRPSDAPDNDAVDDPTVVKAGSTYVMYYTGYAEDGGPPAIFQATSANGRSWTKQDADKDDADLDPVLAGNPFAFDAHGVYGAEVVYDASAPAASRYTMYYSGRGDVFDRIGRATSSDGITWQKYDADNDTQPDFVLDHGKAGARDSFAAAHPSVLKDGQTWKMWYEGDDSNQKSINYATSDDGIDWSKGGAVVEPGSGNIEFGAFAPTVWKTSSTSYHMLLGVQKETGSGTGIFQTKVQEASSSDGIDWTTGSIAMNPASSRFDAFDLNSPDVLEDPGAGSSAFKLYYSGTRVTGAGKHSRIGLSQTASGSGWQGGKYSGNQAFQSVVDISPLISGEVFDARHASGVAASPVFAGSGYAGVYWGTRGFDFLPRIGALESADGVNWSYANAGQALLTLGGGSDFDAGGQRDPSLLNTVADGSGKEWHLWFTGINSSGATSIGYANTDAVGGTEVPEHLTWSNPGATAFFSGGAGAFDDGGVSDPYVTQDPDDGKFAMYYVGTNNGVTRIGRAATGAGANANGTYTAASDAVVEPGAAGSYDAGGVDDPVVFQDPVVANKWYMLYTAIETLEGQAIRRIAFATSTDDGVTWAKGGVVLGPSQTPFAFDEAGVAPQGAYWDPISNTVNVWFDGFDRDQRLRGGYASVSGASLSGLLENGSATYQLGGTSASARDWRSILATTTGAGGKELWVSFLQPYSSAGKEYWSGFFPVDAIDQAATLNFLLTVKGVRWQARLADPSGTPSIDKVDLTHANISFFATGDGATQSVTPPSGQKITTWRTLTVNADLFQPTGSGSGSGTVKVLNAAGTTTLASKALNTGGETELDLSAIPVATNQSLKLEFDLTSATPFTASPVVRLAKVLYFTNASQPSITLSATPTTVTSGGAVTLSGKVLRGSTPLANETVTISPAGSATTNSSGDYSLVVNPTATTTYRASAAGTTSAPVTVTVTTPPAPPAPPAPELTLTATPAEVIFGQQVALAGRLTQAAAPLSGQAVQLLAAGSPFATATTSATGDWSATHAPQANTVYSATFPGVATAPSASVGVHQLVKLKATRSGRRLTMAGSIAPAHPGRDVVIQLKKGSSFVTFAKGKTGSTSKFTIRKKVGSCAKFQLRATTAADADHLDGTSVVALAEKHRISIKLTKKRRKITLTGKVAPLHKSGKLVIREIKGKRAVKIGIAKLTRKSAYRFVKTLKKGTHKLRVDMASDRCHFAGKSAVRTAKLR